jgi:hypothetical protein
VTPRELAVLAAASARAQLTEENLDALARAIGNGAAQAVLLREAGQAVPVLP